MGNVPYGVWGTGKAWVAGACRGERSERRATVWNLEFVLCGIEVTGRSELEML